MKAKSISLGGKRFGLYISKEMIARRVRELGREINHDFEGKTLVLLCVLNGSFIFAADLIRSLKIDCEFQTISAKSYGDLMESSGGVEISGLGEGIIGGKDILIVEDIVDTGNTMAALVNFLEKLSPLSINICSLLHKPELLVNEINIKYLGFTIPPRFVVGYGLDCAGKGRQFPDIYALTGSDTK